MRRLRVSDLEEGMKVAADVRNLEDLLLLPSGTELTPRHIRILRSWGVESVHVECPDGTAADSACESRVSPEEVAALEREMVHRFWQYNPADAAQRELLRLMAERRARQISRAS